MLQGLLEFRRGQAFQDEGSICVTRLNFRPSQPEVREGLKDCNETWNLPREVDVEVCISWMVLEYPLTRIFANGAFRVHSRAMSKARACKKHRKRLWKYRNTF